MKNKQSFLIESYGELEPVVTKVSIKGRSGLGVGVPLTLYFKDDEELERFKKICNLNITGNYADGSKILNLLEEMFNNESEQ